MLWQWGWGAFSYEKQGRTLLAAVWQKACLPGLIARAQGRPWHHSGANRSELRGHWTMSLPSLDLRDMDSEMETAGIVGPTTGGSRGVGFQEQKPLQQACFQETGWSAAQLHPTLHGTWAEQAPSRCLPPCHCLIQRALLSCVRPVFKGGQGLSPIIGSEPGPYCFQINITCHKCGWGTSKT